MIKKVCLYVFLLALSACATTSIRTYDGPARPVEKIAIIQGGWLPGLFSQREAGVVEIDGRVLAGFHDKVYHTVEVLPGSHSITVRMEKTVNYRTRRCPVKLRHCNLLAGHKYGIHFRNKELPFNVEASIRDFETEEVICVGSVHCG